MILPVVIVVGAVWGSLWGPKTAATTMIGAELLDGKKRQKETERNNRLDINPEKEKFEKARQMEMAKKGIPPQPRDLVYFKIEESDLPPGQAWLAGEYFQTEDEQIQFLDAVRKDSLERKLGPLGERLEQMCMSHGLTHEEVADLCWRGWNYDFAWAKKVSAERLADPWFRRMLRKQN
jgi:hypothetical protein